MAKSVKLYFLFALVIIIAVLTFLILQGYILEPSSIVPDQYAPFIVLFLVLLDTVLAYIFYRSYNEVWFLFVIVIIIAILTPHILHGHVLLPEKYAQRYAESIALLLDLALAFMFYSIYRRDIGKIREEQTRTEENLIDSYEYIGKANGQIDLFRRFINFFLFKKENGGKQAEVFNSLLITIMNSVAKSEKGFIRFIDAGNGRTIKEFTFHKNGEQVKIKLPNAKVIKKDFNFEKVIENGEEINIVASDLDDSRVKCVLCYIKNQEEETDLNLLKTLLNQVHLLFLAIWQPAIR